MQLKTLEIQSKAGTLKDLEKFGKPQHSKSKLLETSFLMPEYDISIGIFHV